MLKASNSIAAARSSLQQARYVEAIAYCEQILSAQPEEVDALVLLGVAQLALGRVDEGIARLRAAVQAQPAKDTLWLNLAGGLSRAGRPGEALDCLRTAVTHCQPSGALLHNLALAQQTAGDTEGAIETYRRCLQLEPARVEAHNNLGTLLQRRKELPEAIGCFREALRLQPDYVRALTNLGSALTEAGTPAEALQPLGTALRLSPRHAPALINLGNAFWALRHLQGSHECFRQAVSAAPHLAHGHLGLARTLLEYGEAWDAVDSCSRALELRPDLIEAGELRAKALERCGELRGAMQALEVAAAANPRDPRAPRLRAAALRLQGHALQTDLRFQEALSSYEQALALTPGDSEALGGILTCHMVTCEWSAMAERLQQLRASPGGTEALPPLVLLGVSDDPAEHLRASAYQSRLAMPADGALPLPAPYGHDKIRIAYLSRDFCYHATSLLMAELLELHDRSRFEIFGVSYSRDDGSPLRKRVVAAFDRFLDANAMTDREVALWLRERQIDIAVDLKGHTRGPRTRILAYRPAPVQVNYLGYPGTMAAPFIDYIVADEVVLPPEHRGDYSEQAVYLPGSYQVNDRKRAVADAPSTRGDVGLPERAFVFCCFNNNWKITPAVFDIWMRLLSEVPGSVLWLLGDNDRAAANLRTAALARGVEPERLIFCPRIEVGAHLARQRLADLFLDTLPVNAHTTASDALWVGLPVVTCLGRTFAGRVAASLLRAVGLEQLIAPSLAEYAALALALARDPQRLQAIRAGLVRRRNELPLFDTPAFCRNLEEAYRQMWLRHERGEPPKTFEVVPQ